MEQLSKVERWQRKVIAPLSTKFFWNELWRLGWAWNFYKGGEVEKFKCYHILWKVIKDCQNDPDGRIILPKDLVEDYKYWYNEIRLYEVESEDGTEVPSLVQLEPRTLYSDMKTKYNVETAQIVDDRVRLKRVLKTDRGEGIIFLEINIWQELVDEVLENMENLYSQIEHHVVEASDKFMTDHEKERLSDYIRGDTMIPEEVGIDDREMADDLLSSAESI